MDALIITGIPLFYHRFLHIAARPAAGAVFHYHVKEITATRLDKILPLRYNHDSRPATGGTFEHD